MSNKRIIPYGTCAVCGGEVWHQNRNPKFCSQTCYRSPIRMWEHVDKSGGADACWNWTSALDDDGYGEAKRIIDGKRVSGAHRLAWTVANGNIPDGLWILHKCDNRACCNPSHLFLGDAAANNADMIRKGRGMGPRGELSGHAKLTAPEVIEIRRLHADGVTQRAIAAQFKVGFKAVCKIVHRERWAHI